MLAALALIVACEQNVITEEPVSFNGSTIPDQTYVVGDPIRSLTLLPVHGMQPVTYSLTPSAPGLSFAPDSRTLEGSPSAIDSYPMSYRAVNTHEVSIIMLTLASSITLNRYLLASRARERLVHGHSLLQQRQELPDFTCICAPDRPTRGSAANMQPRAG